MKKDFKKIVEKIRKEGNKKILIRRQGNILRGSVSDLPGGPSR